jgi:Domain of unknown function (DUF4126)
VARSATPPAAAREPAVTLVLQIASGIGLASCAGLRAFLPLFAVGVAGRAGWLPLRDGFEWLASTPALVVLGTAVLMEMLADKIPIVDHALDAVAIFVKPMAGAVALASRVATSSPLAAVVLALILGAPIAGGVHLLKAKARLLSTLTTCGLANPVQSTAEDAASVAGCVLCLAVPFVFLALLLLLLILSLRRRSVRPGLLA